MADAAATATGCTVELTIDPMNRCRTMVNNPTLLGSGAVILADAGIADDPIDPNAGSTDMANGQPRGADDPSVSAIVPRGTPGHSREFAEHAGGEDGDRMLPLAIRLLAATAVELLTQPGARRPRHGRSCARPAVAATGRAGRLSDILAGQAATRRCWPSSTTSSTMRSPRTSRSIASRRGGRTERSSTSAADRVGCSDLLRGGAQKG